MKTVVIGGTGLIGAKTVAILRQGGHEVVAASRKAGVNTVIGQGLKEAMAGARVVIDVSNAPSFDAKAPKLLDEALRGSLWARQISREDEDVALPRCTRRCSRHAPISSGRPPRRRRGADISTA
jgi:hypothetical protein